MPDESNSAGFECFQKPTKRRLPNVKNPEWVAEYRRQALAIAENSRANPAREADFWQWANAVQTDAGWV
jgi:hypothetical protein